MPAPENVKMKSGADMSINNAGENIEDTSNSYADLKVPIYFSVTGHRDIPISSHSDVRKIIEEYFKGFKKDYPNTPLFLISALAEGGDRIAANAALNSGVNLVAALPMEQKSYEKTFYDDGRESGELIDEFRGLLSRSVNSEKSYLITDERTADPSCNEIDSKYRALGEFLVSNSHIVLALWDGKYINAHGGTSDVVRMAEYGIDRNHVRECRSGEEIANIDFLNIVDRCLVYWINVCRGECTEGYVPTGRYVEPNKIPDFMLKEEFGTRSIDTRRSLPDYEKDLFGRMEDMNSDMLKSRKHRGKKNGRRVTDNRTVVQGVEEDHTNGDVFYLLPSEGSSEIENGLIDSIKRSETAGLLAKRFAVADRLAVKYRDRSFFNKNLYLTLVTFSSIFLMIYLTVFDALVIIMAYAAFLILSMLFYWHYAVRLDRMIHKRFLEYRRLAEFMRVQYYWSLMGIDCKVPALFYEYLRDSTRWIRNTMRGWISPLNIGIPDDRLSKDPGMIDLMEKAWVEDQKKYHEKTGERTKIRTRTHTTIGNIFTVSAISATVVIVAFGTLFSDTGDTAYLIGISAASIVLLLNLIVALSNIGVNTENTIRGTHIHGGSPEEIDLKIKMMEVVTERLDYVIENKGSYRSEAYGEVCKRIFYEFGVQCLEECSDWASTHVAKYISSPRAR
jgi:hypothetical protein